MAKNKTAKGVLRRLESLEKKQKKNTEKLRDRDERPTLKIGTQEVGLKKAFVSPNFKSKTVLTDSTWNYVEIYLRQKSADPNSKEALFYWEQARNFYQASKSLSMVSKPLTTYYCFLNAAKALLKVKGHSFNLKHGVTGSRKEGHFVLQNEYITLKPKGVVSGLCDYLGNPVKNGEPPYSLKDVFYNLSFIHRAFQLSYNGPQYPELFIPIQSPRYVFDKDRKLGWFETTLEEEHSNSRTLSNLVGFSIDRKYENNTFYTIRRNKTFTWNCRNNKPTDASVKALLRYHQKIRRQLKTIYGPDNLWYIKRTNLINNIIPRTQLVLIYAAMHRLSEMARYQPQSLIRHFEKNHSWLLNEFINKAPLQFIDEISCEITGDDFRVTGFRA